MAQEDLRSLLEHLSIIEHRYQRRKEDVGFNLIPLLTNETDEVRLHSKFIHELLSPKGSHRLGAGLLKAFLRSIEPPLQTVNGDPVPSINEDQVTVKNEDDSIDLTIVQHKPPTLAIIIENKVFAGDQPRQLANYLEKMESRGFEHNQIAVCYLSLFEGDSPSDDSLRDRLEHHQINHLSYENDIINWLEECIRLAARKPPLRESLIQYQQTVKKLTHQDMETEQFEEIIELLKEGNNNQIAGQIAKNWNAIKAHSEYLFWKDLETKVRGAGYEILFNEKYSEQWITDFHNHNYRGEHYYGLAFKINAHFEGYDACIKIRRLRAPEFVFYGLRMFDGEHLVKHDEHNFEERNFHDIYERLEGLEKSDGLESNQFIFRLFLNRDSERINFTTFDEPTPMLLNDDYRSKFIDNAWKEVKETIEKVESLLQ